MTVWPSVVLASLPVKQTSLAPKAPSFSENFAEGEANR
jgi:hypothetical protein